MRRTHGSSTSSASAQRGRLSQRVSRRSGSLREEAVRYWISSGKTESEVAHEWGVSGWSLSRWRRALEGDTTPVSDLLGITEPNVSPNPTRWNWRAKWVACAARMRRSRVSATLCKRLSASSRGKAHTEEEMIAALIAPAPTPTFTVREVCAALEVCVALELSESGFYAHRQAVSMLTVAKKGVRAVYRTRRSLRRCTRCLSRTIAATAARVWWPLSSGGRFACAGHPVQ